MLSMTTVGENVPELSLKRVSNVAPKPSIIVNLNVTAAIVFELSFLNTTPVFNPSTETPRDIRTRVFSKQAIDDGHGGVLLWLNLNSDIGCLG